MRRSTNGFTLIELLVVIAVIAVLISILVPALSKAREEAYKVKCMASARGIGVAANTYADDHRGELPPVHPGLITWLPPSTRDSFDRYLGGQGDAFYCPTLRNQVNKYEPDHVAPGSIRDKWDYTEAEIGRAQNQIDFHYICNIYVGNPTYGGANPDLYFIDSDKDGDFKDEYLRNTWRDDEIAEKLLLTDIQPNQWHPLANTYRHPSDSDEEHGSANQLYGDMSVQNKRATEMKLRWYPPNPVKW